MPPSRDERIEQLELKLAYLERGSQELSDVVYSQQQALDELVARVARLTERVQAAEERPRDYAGEEERPPHY